MASSVFGPTDHLLNDRRAHPVVAVDGAGAQHLLQDYDLAPINQFRRHEHEPLPKGLWSLPVTEYDQYLRTSTAAQLVGDPYREVVGSQGDINSQHYYIDHASRNTRDRPRPSRLGDNSLVVVEDPEEGVEESVEMDFHYSLCPRLPFKQGLGFGRADSPDSRSPRQSCFAPPPEYYEEDEIYAGKPNKQKAGMMGCFGMGPTDSMTHPSLQTAPLPQATRDTSPELDAYRRARFPTHHKPHKKAESVVVNRVSALHLHVKQRGRHRPRLIDSAIDMLADFPAGASIDFEPAPPPAAVPRRSQPRPAGVRGSSSVRLSKSLSQTAALHYSTVGDSLTGVLKAARPTLGQQSDLSPLKAMPVTKASNRKPTAWNPTSTLPETLFEENEELEPERQTQPPQKTQRPESTRPDDRQQGRLHTKQRLQQAALEARAAVQNKLHTAPVQHATHPGPAQKPLHTQPQIHSDGHTMSSVGGHGAQAGRSSTHQQGPISSHRSAPASAGQENRPPPGTSTAQAQGPIPGTGRKTEVDTWGVSESEVEERTTVLKPLNKPLIAVVSSSDGPRSGSDSEPHLARDHYLAARRASPSALANHRSRAALVQHMQRARSPNKKGPRPPQNNLMNELRSNKPLRERKIHSSEANTLYSISSTNSRGLQLGADSGTESKHRYSDKDQADEEEDVPIIQPTLVADSDASQAAEGSSHRRNLSLREQLTHPSARSQLSDTSQSSRSLSAPRMRSGPDSELLEHSARLEVLRTLDDTRWEPLAVLEEQSPPSTGKVNLEEIERRAALKRAAKAGIPGLKLDKLDGSAAKASSDASTRGGPAPSISSEPAAAPGRSSQHHSSTGTVAAQPPPAPAVPSTAPSEAYTDSVAADYPDSQDTDGNVTDRARHHTRQAKPPLAPPSSSSGPLSTSAHSRGSSLSSNQDSVQRQYGSDTDSARLGSHRSVASSKRPSHRVGFLAPDTIAEQSTEIDADIPIMAWDVETEATEQEDNTNASETTERSHSKGRVSLGVGSLYKLKRGKPQPAVVEGAGTPKVEEIESEKEAGDVEAVLRVDEPGGQASLKAAAMKSWGQKDSDSEAPSLKDGRSRSEEPRARADSQAPKLSERRTASRGRSTEPRLGERRTGSNRGDTHVTRVIPSGPPTLRDRNTGSSEARAKLHTAPVGNTAAEWNKANADLYRSSVEGLMPGGQLAGGRQGATGASRRMPGGAESADQVDSPVLCGFGGPLPAKTHGKPVHGRGSVLIHAQPASDTDSEQSPGRQQNKKTGRWLSLWTLCTCLVDPTLSQNEFVPPRVHIHEPDSESELSVEGVTTPTVSSPSTGGRPPRARQTEDAVDDVLQDEAVQKKQQRPPAKTGLEQPPPPIAPLTSTVLAVMMATAANSPKQKQKQTVVPRPARSVNSSSSGSLRGTQRRPKLDPPKPKRTDASKSKKPGALPTSSQGSNSNSETHEEANDCVLYDMDEDDITIVGVLPKTAHQLAIAAPAQHAQRPTPAAAQRPEHTRMPPAVPKTESPASSNIMGYESTAMDSRSDGHTGERETSSDTSFWTMDISPKLAQLPPARAPLAATHDGRPPSNNRTAHQGPKPLAEVNANVWKGRRATKLGESATDKPLVAATNLDQAVTDKHVIVATSIAETVMENHVTAAATPLKPVSENSAISATGMLNAVEDNSRTVATNTGDSIMGASLTTGDNPHSSSAVVSAKSATGKLVPEAGGSVEAVPVVSSMDKPFTPMADLMRKNTARQSAVQPLLITPVLAASVLPSIVKPVLPLASEAVPTAAVKAMEETATAPVALVPVPSTTVPTVKANTELTTPAMPLVSAPATRTTTAKSSANPATPIMALTAAPSAANSAKADTAPTTAAVSLIASSTPVPAVTAATTAEMAAAAHTPVPSVPVATVGSSIELTTAAMKLMAAPRPVLPPAAPPVTHPTQPMGAATVETPTPSTPMPAVESSTELVTAAMALMSRTPAPADTPSAAAATSPAALTPTQSTAVPRVKPSTAAALVAEPIPVVTAPAVGQAGTFVKSTAPAAHEGVDKILVAASELTSSDDAVLANVRRSSLRRSSLSLLPFLPGKSLSRSLDRSLEREKDSVALWTELHNSLNSKFISLADSIAAAATAPVVMAVAPTTSSTSQAPVQEVVTNKAPNTGTPAHEVVQAAMSNKATAVSPKPVAVIAPASPAKPISSSTVPAVMRINSPLTSPHRLPGKTPSIYAVDESLDSLPAAGPSAAFSPVKSANLTAADITTPVVSSSPVLNRNKPPAPAADNSGADDSCEFLQLGMPPANAIHHLHADKVYTRGGSVLKLNSDAQVGATELSASFSQLGPLPPHVSLDASFLMSTYNSGLDETLTPVPAMPLTSSAEDRSSSESMLTAVAHTSQSGTVITNMLTKPESPYSWLTLVPELTKPDGSITVARPKTSASEAEPDSPSSPPLQSVVMFQNPELKADLAADVGSTSAELATADAVAYAVARADAAWSAEQAAEREVAGESALHSTLDLPMGLSINTKPKQDGELSSSSGSPATPTYRRSGTWVDADAGFPSPATPRHRPTLTVVLPDLLENVLWSTPSSPQEEGSVPSSAEKQRVESTPAEEEDVVLVEQLKVEKEGYEAGPIKEHDVLDAGGPVNVAVSPTYSVDGPDTPQPTVRHSPFKSHRPTHLSISTSQASATPASPRTSYTAPVPQSLTRISTRRVENSWDSLVSTPRAATTPRGGASALFAYVVGGSDRRSVWDSAAPSLASSATPKPAATKAVAPAETAVRVNHAIGRMQAWESTSSLPSPTGIVVASQTNMTASPASPTTSEDSTTFVPATILGVRAAEGQVGRSYHAAARPMSLADDLAPLVPSPPAKPAISYVSASYHDVPEPQHKPGRAEHAQQESFALSSNTSDLQTSASVEDQMSTFSTFASSWESFLAESTSSSMASYVTARVPTSNPSPPDSVTRALTWLSTHGPLSVSMCETVNAEFKGAKLARYGINGHLKLTVADKHATALRRMLGSKEAQRQLLLALEWQGNTHLHPELRLNSALVRGNAELGPNGAVHVDLLSALKSRQMVQQMTGEGLTLVRYRVQYSCLPGPPLQLRLRCRQDSADSAMTWLEVCCKAHASLSDSLQNVVITVKGLPAYAVQEDGQPALTSVPQGKLDPKANSFTWHIPRMSPDAPKQYLRLAILQAMSDRPSSMPSRPAPPVTVDASFQLATPLSGAVVTTEIICRAEQQEEKRFTGGVQVCQRGCKSGLYSGLSQE